MNDELQVNDVDVTSPAVLGDGLALDGAATLGLLGCSAAGRELLEQAMGAVGERDLRPASDEIGGQSPASATIRLIARVTPRRTSRCDGPEPSRTNLGRLVEQAVQEAFVSPHQPAALDPDGPSALVAHLLDEGPLVDVRVADGCAPPVDLERWWRREIVATTGEARGLVTAFPCSEIWTDRGRSAAQRRDVSSETLAPRPARSKKRVSPDLDELAQDGAESRLSVTLRRVLRVSSSLYVIMDLGHGDHRNP